MKIPPDAPTWLISIIEGLDERLGNEVRNAETADSALKASGAFGLWAVIREELALETERQAAASRERMASLLTGRERTAEN